MLLAVFVCAAAPLWVPAASVGSQAPLRRLPVLMGAGDEPVAANEFSAILEELDEDLSYDVLLVLS